MKGKPGKRTQEVKLKQSKGNDEIEFPGEGWRERQTDKQPGGPKERMLFPEQRPRGRYAAGNLPRPGFCSLSLVSLCLLILLQGLPHMANILERRGVTAPPSPLLFSKH